ncbi:MAG: CHAT domain-containing protein [Xenococcaceae cyanobacterium]
MKINQNIVSLTNQASLALKQKDHQTALDTYTQALKIAREEKLPRFTAVILNYIGDTFQAQGEIQDAVIAYEAALEALESEDTLKLESVIDRLSEVSKGFYSNPDPVPDLYSAEVAETLEAEANDPALPIKLCLDIGNAYLRQPQEAPALKAYQQALQYPEIDRNLLLKAYAIANLGEIYRRQDNLELAETNIQEALELFDDAGKPLEKRRGLAILASITSDRNQFDKAEMLYLQSLHLYEQAQDNLGKGKTSAGLARLYLEQKRFSDAQPIYRQAFEIAQTERDWETLGHCYWGLGCCYQEAGELKQAIASFEKAVNLIESRQEDLRTDEGKVTFLDSVKDVFDRLLIAHLDLAERENGDYQAALEVAESARGRALSDLMGKEERRHPQLKKQEKVDRLDDLQTKTGVQPNSFSNMTVQAASGIPSNSSNNNAIDSATETDRSIKVSPLARLVFYVLLDRTAIFAVTPDGKVSGYVSPIGCHELEQKVARLRRAMKVDEASRGVERKLLVVEQLESVEFPPVTLETLLKEFYNDLVAPVAEALPTDGCTLVIEPHASLWLVPFAALQLPDGKYMCDRWSLIYTPSAQTLEEIRNQPCYATIDESKILAVGNPVMPTVLTQEGFEITLSPLSGAEEEAKAIVESWGDREYTLLLREAATEAAVKDFAQTHNIIHLATHGIAYTENPLKSFVAFSPTETENGLLTAREVAHNRDLPADLVVLSACQTGLGRVSGDGMLGLSRAFLIAGARTIIVSQWSVSDRATKELMVAFYQNYVELKNKVIALQRAMQLVRSKYKHPSCWAAFLMVGAEI